MRWTRLVLLTRALTRTVKSCGSDAPTLASSGDNACALRLRWWQTSPVTRESTKEPVKTIAQGRPDDLGKPVVTYSYAFSFCMRGCGCGGHPAFPAPSVFEGRISYTTRAQTRRGNTKAWPRVPGAGQHERSEMMRCRTGTHLVRSMNGSRFCEAALHAAIHARDTKRWRGMTMRIAALMIFALRRAGPIL